MDFLFSIIVYLTFTIYRKYERTKEIIGEFKRNEDLLKAQVKDVSEKLRKSEERYELLKSHAEGKLNEYVYAIIN